MQVVTTNCGDCHVQDFDSAALKNKKHWNSFTTPFFIEVETVLTDLQNKDCVDIEAGKAEGLLKQGLLCHICHQPMKNMPTLKSHIQNCNNSKH